MGVCQRCFSIVVIDVHGHEQCVDCGFYVNECCQGETCEQG